ncbi:carboxypeptidase-like protein A1 precursor [Polyplosphaeria fusca]|uniref:Carboxypeptidase-like protein A1 n=1 Tax=Polyplosphaeria fusca TaxID=682080 RepID=A0A9P4UWE6_9PLEO|nr:carboxypeptidase-like protein A1 precursor [Polyplosphaeria fusca]
MRSLLVSCLFASLALSTVVPRARQKVDYSGFKVLRVSLPEQRGDVEAKIEELAAHVLNPGKVEHLDVVVSPDKVDAVKKLVATSKVINEDVGAALAEEGEIKKAEFSVAAVPSESWFTAYHAYADHITFLRDLQAGYTGQSEIITTGTSVQGRTLTGIHIWGSGGKGSKPAVLFHGTVHAREWISSMTVEYMAWQLLTKYSSNATVKALVDKFDLYIIPIVNPDGFVYSQTSDRLWRKNRQTVSGNSCVGRDINRNWPYKWEVPGGASTNPCSETYKGQAAGDSPENKGLRAHVDSLRDSRGLSLYIDFHSYGQYMLWPYGYDCNLVVHNDAQHRSLATRAAAAIRAVSGTRYTIGPACSTLYATTGDSTDYTDAVGNSTYSYTYELRDTGSYGFTLPANQIQPTVRETWEGVVSMLKDV